MSASSLFLRKLSEKHLRQLLLSNCNNLTKSKKFYCGFLPEWNTVKAELVNQLLLFAFWLWLEAKLSLDCEHAWRKRLRFTSNKMFMKQKQDHRQIYLQAFVSVLLVEKRLCGLWGLLHPRSSFCRAHLKGHNSHSKVLHSYFSSLMFPFLTLLYWTSKGVFQLEEFWLTDHRSCNNPYQCHLFYATCYLRLLVFLYHSLFGHL